MRISTRVRRGPSTSTDRSIDSHRAMGRPAILVCPKCGGPRRRAYVGAKGYICRRCVNAARRVTVRVSRRKLVCPNCGGPREPREEKQGDKVVTKWRCFPCIRERTRQRTAADPARKRAADRAYRASAKGRGARRRQQTSESAKARNRTEEGRARGRANARVNYARHPDRVKARVAAYQKFVSTRPDACSRCGKIPPSASDGRSSLQLHHPNGYDGPHAFEIEWLCRSCHGRAHRRYA
jgi:hypothetical protein